MEKDLKVALKITADGKGAVGEVGRVKDAVSDLGVDAGSAKPKVDALSGAVEKVGDAAPDARKTADAVDEVGDSAKSATGKTDGLVAGLKALAGAAVVREFISANASLESLEKSLEAVTGSSESAKKEMEFVRAEAGRLGLEIGGAANSYLQLAASAKGTALEGDKTRQIWSAVAGSMAVLGKSTEDTQGALNAVSQMMSKGVISMEEWRQQLGERLPIANQVAAKAMGVTNTQLFEMIESGKLLAADLLPKFAAELSKTGGDGGAISTFNANMARMKNALSEVATSLGDTGIFDAITWSLSKLADATSYATLGFKALAAKIKGDDAGLLTLAEQAEQVRNRLFGIGDATKKVAGGVAEMGAQVTHTSTQIEQDIREKIAGSLIKLDSTIKSTDEAFKKLGVDPGEITQGISAAEREIIQSFKRIAADPSSNGALLTSSLLMALDKVSKEAVPEIGFAYKAAANAGRQSSDELAAGLNALTTKSKDLWAGMVEGGKKSAAEVTALDAAYKTLGITSQKALQETAVNAKSAYEQIKAGGASLADQAAAWKVYAERAIAANGGVASSMIQAEAAQHGYTISVDESGKALLKLKQVIEDAEDAATRAANSVRAANTQMMESASIAASQARSSIGSMQGSIDDFYSHMRGLGDGVSGILNATRLEMFKLSEAALEMFNATRAGQQGGTLGAYLEDLAKNAAQVRLVFEQQTTALAILQAQVDSGALSQKQLADATIQLSYAFNILGEERLAPLRQAIADAENRLRSLRDAASDTLATIQDEWDSLNNNLDEIEARRAVKRAAEIDAQIAVSKGDREAIANLERAKQLLADITKARIAEAKARESAIAEKSLQPAQTTASHHTVTIKLPNGTSSTIKTASAADSLSLAEILRQLEDDKRRS